MKAAVINHYGDASKFAIAEHLPLPQPAPNQVQIQVKAAGINPLDWRIRKGDLRLLVPGSLPMVLGNDVAGVITAVGSDVSNFNVGDRVFCMLDAAPEPSNRGFAKPGAYAEYAVTREDTLALIPRGIDYVSAAAVPLAALTAYQVLTQKVQLQPGQAVIINGASGGVGTFAVQIAKALGAQVTAICSAANTNKVLALGADKVIDYKSTPLDQIDGQYDLFYDVVCNASYAQIKSLLTPKGRYVSNVATGATLLSTGIHRYLLRNAHQQKKLHAWVKPSGNDLQAIADLMEKDALVPVIEKVYSIETIKEAHEHIEKGHVKGKLVISMENQFPTE